MLFRSYYIKRLIGLPGDRVVVQDGAVKIYVAGAGEGQTLNENYLATDVKTLGKNDVTLGKDEYFVLGDNRYYSFDSRSWGAVHKNEIVGIARLRLLPISSAQAFEAPMY